MLSPSPHAGWTDAEARNAGRTIFDDIGSDNSARAKFGLKPLGQGEGHATYPPFGEKPPEPEPRPYLKVSNIKAWILDKAKEITSGARRAAYGPPEKNFDRIALLWNAHLLNTGRLKEGQPGLNGTDVAILCILLKVARLEETPDHLDSWTDAVGYAVCGAEAAGVKVPA